MVDYAYSLAADAVEQMSLSDKCLFIKTFVRSLATSGFIDAPEEGDPVTTALQALYSVGVMDLIFVDTYDEVEQHVDQRKQNIEKLNRMMGRQ